MNFKTQKQHNTNTEIQKSSLHYLIVLPSLEPGNSYKR